MIKFILLLIHLTLLNATGSGRSATHTCNDMFRTDLPFPKPGEDQGLKKFALQKSKDIAESDKDFDCSRRNTISIKGKKTYWVCKDEPKNTKGYDKVVDFCYNFVKNLSKIGPSKINPRKFRKYGCAIYDNNGNAAIVCAFKERRKKQFIE